MESKTSDASTVDGAGDDQEALRRYFYEETTAMREYWYPVCLSGDLKTTEPYPFTLLEEPIVLYRDPATNEAVALADKCPHRSAPLSTGRIMDGKLECRYHGWQFDTDGSVSKVPSLMPGRTIPSNARVKRFPTHEMQGVVWLWPGDPKKCDEAERPKLFHMSDADLPLRMGYIDIDVDHCLMLENFLDPAHIPFTHDTTIGKRSDATAMSISLEFTKRGSILGVPTTPLKPASTQMTFEFVPPITIGLGFVLASGNAADQTFYCVPTKRGFCRFIYLQRFSFFSYIDNLPLPFVKGWFDSYFHSYNRKVVEEDYKMLKGQQDRLNAGANAMNSPVAADLLIKTYRNWWRKVLEREGGPWFKGYSTDMEDMITSDGGMSCAGSASGACNAINTATKNKN